MEHMLGPDWIDMFEFVGVSASKPIFYTGKRPFRMVGVLFVCLFCLFCLKRTDSLFRPVVVALFIILVL